MVQVFRHVLLLFVLAAACYVIAVYAVGSRIGFIVFFSVGLAAECVFWLAFWRQRRSNARRRLDSHA